MSGRTNKRQLSKAGGGSSEGNSAAARKKRRINEANSSDDEERSVWTPKHLGDLRAYNRSASEAPAELFRKDLISAMKLPDNEPLANDDYWGILDPWKQEWERGVQVPVNPDSLPQPAVSQPVQNPLPRKDTNTFRLTKDKFTRVTHNDFFSNEQHILSNLPTKAEKMCRYDMDDLDDKWLTAYNGERARMGAARVPTLIFEMIVEHLEESCWENIHKLLKTEESQNMEFDEDVICDVCRSPDSEEGNEMVFCDSCNICVHQACYGITAIPSGSWLCRTCSVAIKPDCVLCPNKGGAMKSTKSGQKWAHVACALWIPEVSIGSVERMEPITKIPNIPQSRWALVCVLCRERRGACIQCSVKTCKTAYHVTCAFKHGLEMKAIIEDESADDGVKLRSYCEKHSMSNKKAAAAAIGEENKSGDEGGSPKKKKDWSTEQNSQARAAKLRQIEAEFYNHVSVMDTSNALDIDFETTETIFNFWKLKRRAGFNKPLLTPRSEEIDFLSQQQEHDIERMKMFVQLRQYLERVRNLCYMTQRREKVKRSYMKNREQIFNKQAILLGNESCNVSEQEFLTIRQANRGPSIYDKMYSYAESTDHTQKQFKKIEKFIQGNCNKVRVMPDKMPDKIKSEKLNDKQLIIVKTEVKSGSESDSKKPIRKDVNGLIRSRPDSDMNPYKKMYANGAVERRSRSRSSSMYGTSASDSDSSVASTRLLSALPPPNKLNVYTTSEDENTIKENHLRRKIGNLDTTDEDKPTNEPLSRAGRGRVSRKRDTTARGLGKSKPGCREKASSTDENREENSSSKVDLVLDRNDKSISSKTLRVEPPSFDTSEDESVLMTRPKPPIRAGKGRGKKKPILAPAKLNTSISSEDDTPLTPSPNKLSPSKRGGAKESGGRGTEAAIGAPLEVGPKSVSPLRNSSVVDGAKGISDEEDLPPPTYKLTSEEEGQSDKSLDKSPVKKDVFGFSDRSDSGSERGKLLRKGPKKQLEKKSDTIFNDSDAVHTDDEAKDSTSDSQKHAMMLKTKAAMKEFTPKIEARAEKLTKKKSETNLVKAKPKSSLPEKLNEKSKSVVTSDAEVGRAELSESETAPDLSLFVPQRKAAKKASALISSKPGPAPATSGELGDTKLLKDEEKRQISKKEVEKVSPKGRQKKSTKEQDREDGKESEVERGNEKFRDKERERNKSRSSEKDRKKVQTDSESESNEQPKKKLFETPEILPYVPMRQAAKKATANMKGGTVAKPALSTPEESEPSSPSSKSIKRISKPEEKQLARSKSKTPRKQGSKATDDESESEIEVPQTPSKVEKDKQSKSIFSESEDELISPLLRRENPPVNENALTPQAQVQVATSQKEDKDGKVQLFRGEMFIREYQSSSEDEVERPETPGGKETYKVEEKVSRTLKEVSKNQSFRGPTNVSGELNLSSDDERESENQEPAAETHRKAPDKKLKTSEGRPEHGFQPPITERSESRMSPENQTNSSKLSSHRRETGLEQGLCKSGPQAQQRTPPGDVSLHDNRSNTHASPRSTSRRSRKESGREGELAQISSPEETSAKYSNKREILQSPEPGVTTRETSTAGIGQTTPTSRGSSLSPEKKKVVKESIRSSARQSFKDQSIIVPEVSKKTGVFGYVEEEVQVVRLDDIVETSDTEPENKNKDPEHKLHIESSSENSLVADKRVEQPKDSGYKSAITTPEPVDKVQSVICNEVDVNSLVNNIDESIIDSSEKSSHSPVPQSTQQDGNEALNKIVSPSKRKDLEDVIGEMNKQVETQEPIQPEEAIKPEEDIKPETPAQSEVGEPLEAPSSPPVQQQEQSPVHSVLDTPATPEPTLPSPTTDEPQHDTDSQDASSPKCSPTTTNFREKWRASWVDKSSPPPPDSNKDLGNPPTPMGPQMSIGGLEHLPQHLNMLYADPFNHFDPFRQHLPMQQMQQIQHLLEAGIRPPYFPDPALVQAYIQAANSQDLASQQQYAALQQQQQQKALELQLAAKSGARPPQELSRISQEHDERIQGLDERLKSHDDRLQGRDDRLQAHEQHSGLDTRLSGADDRLPIHNERLQSHGDRLQGHDDRLQGRDDRLQGPDDRLQGHDDRLQGRDDRLQGPDDRLQGPDDRLQGPDDQVQSHDRLQGCDDRLQPNDRLLGLEDRLQGHTHILQDQDARLQGRNDRIQGHDDSIQAHDSRLQDDRLQVHDSRLQCHDDRLLGHGERLDDRMQVHDRLQSHNEKLPSMDHLPSHSDNDDDDLQVVDDFSDSHSLQSHDDNTLQVCEDNRFSNMESRAPTPDVPALGEIPTSLQAYSRPSQSPTPVLSPSSNVLPSIPSPSSRGSQFLMREESTPVLPQKVSQPGPSPSGAYSKGLDTLDFPLSKDLEVPSLPSSVSVSVQNAVIALDDDSSNEPIVLLTSVDRAVSLPSSKTHLSVSFSQAQPIVSSVTTTPSKNSHVPVTPVTTVSDTTTVTKPSVSPSKVSRRNQQAEMFSPVSKESSVCYVPVVTSTTAIVCCTGFSSVVTCSSSVTSVAKSLVTTSVTTVTKSPVSSTSSPFTSPYKASPSPLHSPLQQVPENKLDSSTVDTSAIQPKEVSGGTTKRIPIYMQDKIPKTSPSYLQESKSRITLEKKSPRSQATSPRWRDHKESTKSRDKKGSAKYNRHSGGKGGRGRGSSKASKGKSYRFNSVSVPKELQGTVYDFDDEFDDDLSPAAPCSLNDLRTMREKRQSVDTKPSPSVDTKPYPSVDTKPYPSVDTKPYPSVDTKPSPSVDTKPSPSVDTKPSPSVDTKPSPSVDIKPSPSVDTKPSPQQQPSSTPTYSSDQKESTSKKGHKKSKSSSKEKVRKSSVSISIEQNSIDICKKPEVENEEEDEDEVAKILAEYRNQQNSKLGRGSSTHEPSPNRIDDPIETVAPYPKSPAVSHEKQIPDFITSFEDSKSVTPEEREITDSLKPISDLSSKIGLTVSTVQGPDERQNQLKLKIKGPYARLSNIVSNPSLPQETAVVPSHNSTLRDIRMKKKEWIRQYCKIEDVPEPNPPPQHSNTISNPPRIRQTISIPKAVASMPSIPTREDYKMYTQQDDHAPVSGSRRRPKREQREAKQVEENTGTKRNNDSESTDASRKRQRGSKESRTQKDKDKEKEKEKEKEKNLSSAKPPPKLRISLSKKGSEVATILAPETRQQSMADNTRQQKPIKKRVPEEDPITKVMNDSLKFREQIMAEFSKPNRKENKSKEERKKSKKRKVIDSHNLTVDIKENNEVKPYIKVLTGDSTNTAPKLVIKFGKGKAKEKTETIGINSIDSSEIKTKCEVKPLKLRLSLPRIPISTTRDTGDKNKDDSKGGDIRKEIPKLKIGALKLKLSRRSDGYVASNSPRRLPSNSPRHNSPFIPHSKAQDQGPGPPDLYSPMQQHPDQVPSSSISSLVNDLSSEVSLRLSSHQDNNQKQNLSTSVPDNASGGGAGVPSGAPVPSGATYPSSGPVLGGAPYEMMGHGGFQNEMDFNSGTEPPSYASPEVGVGGGGLLGSQVQPYPDDDVMRRLEAQLAASDGPATSPTHPSASLHPPPPTLPEVPSLHHTLYNSQKGDNDYR